MPEIDGHVRGDNPQLHLLEKINEAFDDGLPARHGGFSNFIITPDPDLL